MKKTKKDYLEKSELVSQIESNLRKGKEIFFNTRYKNHGGAFFNKSYDPPVVPTSKQYSPKNKNQHKGPNKAQSQNSRELNNNKLTGCMQTVNFSDLQNSSSRSIILLRHRRPVKNLLKISSLKRDLSSEQIQLNHQIFLSTQRYGNPRVFYPRKNKSISNSTQYLKEEEKSPTKKLPQILKSSPEKKPQIKQEKKQKVALKISSEKISERKPEKNVEYDFLYRTISPQKMRQAAQQATPLKQKYSPWTSEYSEAIDQFHELWKKSKN